MILTVYKSVNKYMFSLNPKLEKHANNMQNLQKENV